MIDSRLLVVEDSNTQAFKFSVLLEEQGWPVSIAGTAEAAVAAVGDSLPDLILLDYNLPGMRGDDFCRRIRMNLNTRDIPILMMTSLAPDGAEIPSLENGADDYISSPIVPMTCSRAFEGCCAKPRGKPAFQFPQRPDIDH